MLVFVNCSAAFESIKISNVVQPISCIIFSTAARYDPYNPKAGRIPIIDGTAVSLPIFPAIDNSTEPPIEPIMIASNAW
jgi:hypothetical protein